MNLAQYKDNKYFRLLKNAGMISLGILGVRIVSFLMIPFYTKWLSPEDYGIAELIAVYTALIWQPSTLCIQNGIFIYPNGRPLAVQKRYFSSGMVCTALPLSLLGAVFLVLHIFHRHTGSGGLFYQYEWYIYLVTILSFLNDYLLQFLRAIDKITLYALVGIFQAMFAAVLNLILIPVWGLKGFLSTQVFYPLFAIFIMFLFGKLWRYFDFRSIRCRYYMQMLKYTLPLAPGPILIWFQTSFNRPLLNHYCGLAMVGVFALASKIPNILVQFTGCIFNAWQISAMEEYKKKDFPAFYNNICFANVTCACLGGIGISLAAFPFFKLCIGAQYQGALTMLPMMLFSVTGSLLGQIVGVNFTVRRESRKFLYSNLCAMAASVVSNLILIPRCGILGAVLSLSVCSFTTLLVRYFMTYRSTPIVLWKRYLLFLFCYGTWGGLFMTRIPVPVLLLSAIPLCLLFCLFFHSRIRTFLSLVSQRLHKSQGLS